MTHEPPHAPGDGMFMDRARSIAREGWGHVHPNPMVGCVLVREGVVVGEGYHRRYGGPHAEVEALAVAGEAARGATAYVTLEPCDHHGKTPPCTEALIRAGVRRVVFGAEDPGEVSAGGARALRDAGVEVEGPVWDPWIAQVENPAFFHAARHASPFVALKIAQTLDGALAAAGRRRTRITGEEADVRTHELRTGFDGLLVGAGTVRADDPRLTVRLAPPGRLPPARLVLDPRGETPTSAALFRDAATVPVHVFTRSDVDELELARLEAAGAHVHPVGGNGPILALGPVLRHAWELGMRSILCEGGARLAASLLNDGIARRLYLWVAPRTLGVGSVPAFSGVDTSAWSAFRPAAPPEVHGRDTLLVYQRQEVP